MMRLVVAAVLATGALGGTAGAHPGDDHPPDLRVWRDADGLFELEASFVLAQGDRVQLLKHEGGLVWVPLDKLCAADRAWVKARTADIALLNGTSPPVAERAPAAAGGSELAAAGLFALVALAAGFTALRKRFATATAAVGFAASLGVLTAADEPKVPAAQRAFEPFKDKLKLRTDEQFLYVESNGVPDHRMMVGITAWQQQVPMPQAYTGRNAWRIPLHPKLAEKPVSAKTALFRGAIALAANGVPIFNPIKNDGKTDTFLAGELDEFGGHCGRADDYHYHIAPVHLEKVVGKGNPIGYALDGFPLYGFTDATGKEPKDLDAFNGRTENGAYRYYSTKKYPYVNGGLRGEVTVKDDQVDPQPRASSPRPALPPLRGAKITGFERDEAKGTAVVTYDLNGKAHTVKYTGNADGSYTFVFTDGAGKSVTETYRGRPGGKDGPKKDNPPKKDGPPPKKDGDGPRLPWLAAHFDELDLDGDGFLTAEELKKEVARTFTGYDANKDGKLTKAEYDGKGPAVKSALAGFVRGHAAEFADADGTITREGFEKFMLAMFDKADRKKAGKITKAEASQTGPKKPE